MGGEGHEGQFQTRDFATREKKRTGGSFHSIFMSDKCVGEVERESGTCYDEYSQRRGGEEGVGFETIGFE